MSRRPPTSTLFPTRRSSDLVLFDLFETLVTESVTRPFSVSSLASEFGCECEAFRTQWKAVRPAVILGRLSFRQALRDIATRDRKSTRLNSSHVSISYAVFCL